MTTPDELLPVKRPDVLVADFDTELVVLVPGERRAHRLDEGLSLVLASCDGLTSYAALTDEIAEGTGRTVDETRRWLDASLDTLRALRVLDHEEPVAEG